MSDLNAIYSAIQAAGDAARRAWNTAQRSDGYDRAKELERVAVAGFDAYHRVVEIYKIGLEAKREREQAYDKFVSGPRL